MPLGSKDMRRPQEHGQPRCCAVALAAAALSGLAWTTDGAFLVSPAWPPLHTGPRRAPGAVLTMGTASSSSSSSHCGPHSYRRLSPLFPQWWRRPHKQQLDATPRTAVLGAAAASDDNGPVDVGNDPSGATIVPELSPAIEPAPPGPNTKAILALVGGELLLGLLAFPLGYALKIDPLSSIKRAFSATATAAVGGLGPALLNAVGLSLVLTLPVLILHKVSE